MQLKYTVQFNTGRGWRTIYTSISDVDAHKFKLRHLKRHGEEVDNYCTLIEPL